MWQQLESEIIVVCRNKMRRHERTVSRLEAETARRAKRSTSPGPAFTRTTPDLWEQNPNYDPYRVRRRASALAFGIRRSLAANAYEPKPPAAFEVGKSGGGFRTVASFEIADEAVSRILYRSMVQKNRALFGSHCYAYRQDVGVYDAVRYVSSELQGTARTFVAEYDFKGYFDCIRHDHLKALLKDQAVHATPLEISLCDKFMRAPLPAARPSAAAPRRVVGIPQGTTISLFLANLALLPLDRRLERAGISFTRYADDILLWSQDYSAICTGVNLLHDWSARSGVEINVAKSHGVRLFSKDTSAPTEISRVTEIDFLGHFISTDCVGPKRSRIDQTKSRILAMIYSTLIREPLRKEQRLSRVAGGLDRDYVSLIWQLRRLLYGNLTENQVRRLKKGGYVPRTGLSGVIAQFPVATDREQFYLMDKWMRQRIWLGLRRRAELLTPHLAGMTVPKVWRLSIDDLASASEHSRTTKQVVDLRIPSAALFSDLVQRSIQLHGPSVVRGSTRLYLDP